MRFLLALVLCTNMVFLPVAHAERSNGDSSLVLNYQRAKIAYLQQGSQAFASSFSFLTPADQRVVASQLAGRASLPDIKLSGQVVRLIFGGTTLAFDVTHLQEGYVVLGTTKIFANFGGSIEEIAASLEDALRHQYPTQFDKKISWNAIEKLGNWLVPSAHAVPSGLVWGSLAVILGALVFKGVYEERQAASKKLAATTPRFVSEPVYQYPPMPSGREHVAGGGDYANVFGPTSRPSAEAPAPSPVAPMPLDGDTSGEPPPLPTLPPVKLPDQPPEIDEVPSEDYKKYLEALCKGGDDSISKIMEDTYDFYLRLNHSDNTSKFAEARRFFIRNVFEKLKGLSKDESKASLTQAYLAFVNSNFRLEIKTEELATLDVDKNFNNIDKLGDHPLTTFVNTNDKTTEFVFAGSSPQITFNSETGVMTWVPGLGHNSIEACKRAQAGGSPAAPVTIPEPPIADEDSPD